MRCKFEKKKDLQAAPCVDLEVGKFIHSPFSRAACPIGLCRIVAAATAAVHSGVKGRTLSVGRRGGDGSIGRRRGVVHCSISAAFQ